MSADPSEVLDVFANTLQNVVSNIPFAGALGGALFGFVWGKVKAQSPQEDVTKQMASMIQEVKDYINEKLTYAKQQICEDAIASFNASADDLHVQIPKLADHPEAASIVIATHQKCVEKASEALNVLFDLQWGHVTIHNYAIMAALYLALLDDGIKDSGNWGINPVLKDTYVDRRKRFFRSKEFSKLLAKSMDGIGQGNVALRRLSIDTTQVTNLWYCFNPEVYPYGIPEILQPLAASQGAPTNKTKHVYLQPPVGTVHCVVNNMPGGYLRQVLATREQSTTWHPYYKDVTGSLLNFISPDGSYPKTVEVRYYRIKDASTTKFIGLDHAIKVSLSTGSTVEAPIPGSGTAKGTVVFDTEAVVLNSEHPTVNIFRRGVAEKAKLECVKLGTLNLTGPSNVTVQWKPTASQARSQVLLSAVELMVAA